MGAGPLGGTPIDIVYQGSDFHTADGSSIRSLRQELTRFPTLPLLSGKTLEEAAEVSLGYMKSKLKGLGGVILVNKAGDWAVKWTSESMPWAAAQAGKLHFGIDLNTTSITDML